MILDKLMFSYDFGCPRILTETTVVLSTQLKELTS
ncbi:hypothetical protein M2130_001516 [Polynucleobacter sphagniphilus]|nr:hypothetical protein [Polynucleobacter sphagniphilus]